jgi:hypothetical protein
MNENDYETHGSSFMKRGVLLFFTFIVLGFFSASGCSGTRRVTREEIETTRSVKGTTAPGESARSGEAHATVEKEVIRQEWKTERQGGILTMTFHFIGEVLAFPFQLIANVFRTIF